MVWGLVFVVVIVFMFLDSDFFGFWEGDRRDKDTYLGVYSDSGLGGILLIFYVFVF